MIKLIADIYLKIGFSAACCKISFGFWLAFSKVYIFVKVPTFGFVDSFFFPPRHFFPCLQYCFLLPVFLGTLDGMDTQVSLRW